MNERIRQLAEQALNYAEKNQSADIPRHWFKLHNEKFAELIVAECANVANQHMEHNEGTDYNVGGKIKQHFGVTE